MDIRYFKSLIYLVGFGGLGLALLGFCTKDEGRVTARDLPGGVEDPRETQKEKKNYLNLLKASADTNKPLYRMTKAEIDAELRKSK